jgi:acetyltransferase-like isoleucine patch superfamily enzyme
MDDLTPDRIAQYAARGVLLGARAKLAGDVFFEPPVTLHDCIVVGPVSIGRHSYVGDFTHVAQHTSIGRYCSIANSCTIGAQPHPLGWLSSHPFQYLGLAGAKVATRPWRWTPTRLGHDVWIGANAVVVAGVTVGDGAANGAGAVVTKDVPPYGVVVGNPGRVLKSRFARDVVADLLALRWWNLPPEELRELPFDAMPECLARLREIRRRIPAGESS